MAPRPDELAKTVDLTLLDVAAGAEEIELVLDVRAMLGNDFRLIRDELNAVESAVRLVSVNGGRGRVLLKAALETGRLDDKRQRLACVLVESAAFDFAVTSTGGTSAATALDVERLRECLPEGVGVKAGGIRDAEQAHTLLAA